jgi:chromosomal replication initiator protein
VIAYRFQNLKEHPKHGVLIQDNERPRPALFLTPKEAKAEPLPDAYESSRITIVKIQTAVAEHYGIAPEHMRLSIRDRKIAWPRQLAMLLSRELTVNSLPEIGRRFGGRDHSTILHGIRAAQKRIETDQVVKAAYEMIREKLGA